MRRPFHPFRLLHLLRLAASHWLRFAGLIVVLGLGLGAVGCSDNGPVATGGSGTNTGNAIVSGRIVDSVGQAVPGARVQLYPMSYAPAGNDEPAWLEALSDTADTAGNWRVGGIDSASAGYYNISGRDSAGGFKVLIRGVRVRPSDSMGVGEAALRRPGSLLLGLTDSLVKKGGRIYVPGTGIFLSLDSVMLARGVVVVDSLPAGLLPGLRYLAPGAVEPIQLTEEIEIVSGDTVVPEVRVLRVSHGGDDANDGVTKPFRTIGRAISELRAGDTLLIDPGDYGNERDVELRQSGTLAAPIVIRAVNGTAIVHGRRDSSGLPLDGFLTLDRVSHVIIEGLEIHDFSVGVRIEGGGHHVLRKCWFRGKGAMDVYARNSSDLAVTACTFVDPDDAFDSLSCLGVADTRRGVVLSGVRRVSVDYNYFYGNYFWAVAVGDGSEGVYVGHSIFEGIRGNGILLGAADIGASRSYDLRAEANILREAKSYGATSAIFVDNVAGALVGGNYVQGFRGAPCSLHDSVAIRVGLNARGTVRVQRNVLAYGGSGSGVVLDAPAADSVLVRHNTFYDCSADVVPLAAGSYGIGNNLSHRCGDADLGAANFRGDPMFQGPLVRVPWSGERFVTSYDALKLSLESPFRLQAGSPAKDAGADLGLPYHGAAPEPGAFEIP